MSRVYNFSAGPAALPLAVLEQIKADLFDWQGTGMSVMEVSHRGKEFVSLAARSDANLRKYPTTTACSSRRAVPRCRWR
jgi:phosphoserine aminotransferase